MRAQFRRMSTAAAFKVKDRDLGKWARPASAQPPAPPPTSPASSSRPAKTKRMDLKWTPDMTKTPAPAATPQPAPASASVPLSARLAAAASAPAPGAFHEPFDSLAWTPDAPSEKATTTPEVQQAGPSTVAPPTAQQQTPSSRLFIQGERRWTPDMGFQKQAEPAAPTAPAAAPLVTDPSQRPQPPARRAETRKRPAPKESMVWSPGHGTSLPPATQAREERRQRTMPKQEVAPEHNPWPEPRSNARRLSREQREPRIEDALDAGLFGFGDAQPTQQQQQRQAQSTRERTKKDFDGNRDRDVVRKPKVKKPKTAKAKPARAKTDVFIPEVITVGNLAKVLNVPMRNLQHAMVQAGMEENTDYDQVLSYEYASLLAQEFGKNAVMNEEAAFDIFPQPEPANKTGLPPRPPVVTIMGHVDHGKTTLLDTLRSTSVAKGEAGGITQHIGAFSVPVKGGAHSITFLDTPGHAAFSAMRARGASVTDVVVLVVAADDGVMAQTEEVIELIKKDADSLGVVVALTKCDRAGADPELVRLQLMAEGIEIESLGGDIPAVEVSGLTGQGLDELVDTISTVAELMDLRAERSGPAHGTIIESKVVQGIGPVATVLVHRGELAPGATLICGTTSARVRTMADSHGAGVSAAYPGDAVTVSGWKEVPKAGDEVLQASDKDIQRALANRVRRAQSAAMLEDAQAINTYRRLAKEKREESAAAAAAEEGGKKAQKEVEAPEAKKEDGPRMLNIVVKADVHGSEEAVVGALQEIGNHQACTRIIHSAVGDVTESDIELAKTAGGMVVAFNVKCPRTIEVMANTNSVPVFSSGIIYRCTDDVRARVSALIPPIIEKKVIGEANVLALFEISQRGKAKPLKVAGCRIANGVVHKTKFARVLRNKEIMFEGPIETLRHHKEDVMEMKKGQDCGLSVKGFDDPQVGDIIQIYTIVEKPVIL